jgi:glycosyltransferase involved in cell wall biosynthesis
MKKVLIVFNHPAPYKVRLFNELSKYFDLHVIFERNSASDRNKGFYFEEKYNFTTHKIHGIKVGREGLISSGVKKHLQYNEYDLIIMNGYSHWAEMKAIDWMKKWHAPYVLYINGGTIKKESRLKKKIKHHYIARANAYFSPDEESNKYLIYYGANPKVIYNYPYSTIYEKEINYERPNKSKLREELGIKFDKVFVSSGQLIARKNYISLIKEWEKYPENYGLFLIGDGKQRKEIEKLIKTDNIKNVVLTGFLPRKEMFKYFQAADCFLFPSKEDIYGHVINEAFSQGLPVISTNKVNSAIKLVRNAKNGFMLESLEGDEFAKAIEEVINNDFFIECIQTAKANTIETMTERHIEMIEEVMK